MTVVRSALIQTYGSMSMQENVERQIALMTKYARVGVYICYDRHFPEGARCLGLNGAEIVYIPSATSRGLSMHLWKIEQVSHTIANGYWVGTINRVGKEPLDAPVRVDAPSRTARACSTSLYALAHRSKTQPISALLDSSVIVRYTLRYRL